MIRLNEEKLARLHTADEILEKEYGAPGTPTRDAFEARAKAWYYAELLKEERKRQKLTQQQLADKIGKKREYIALLEKGETDMQLSTFLMITDAVGLKFGLTL